MASLFFRIIFIGLMFCHIDDIHAGEPLKLYFEENAQIELINSEGTRVLIIKAFKSETAFRCPFR